MIIANLQRNAGHGQTNRRPHHPANPRRADWPCHSALKNAILTDKKFWPKKTVTELKPILEKYL